MKTKGRRKEKVNIVTLGCAKNIVDSEVILTQLKGNDIDAVHESKENDATTVIINTCGFIENAKQESIETILNFVEAKEQGHIEKVYVTGCLSHRYKDDLRKEIPNVDDYFGTTDLKGLLAKFKADYKHELLGERISTSDSHYAHLKIAEGCDRPCSFCAIPIMRGKHVSRPIEELVEETKNLVKNGAKEILLIAQDSTYYGLDLYKKRNLAELMERLSEIEGLEWIRLHYAFPTGFPMDVLDVMKAKPNICNYLDIPLQHGSTKILKSMRRGTDREKTQKLLDEVRNQIPDIAIRTTLIAGHPGETEEDFQEMMEFVERSQFDRMGVFAYSHEEDTHSGSMVDDVPEEVKEQRVEALMELQEGISFEKNLKKVGNTYRVLIDRKDGEYFIGRTEYDSPDVDNEVLIVATEDYLRIGDFYNVKITNAEPFDLYGDVVE
ncbi:MAG: 30S ribosomal protein S12 methylthiotransferase RimO [Reichenbachiella sp.]